MQKMLELRLVLEVTIEQRKRILVAGRLFSELCAKETIYGVVVVVVFLVIPKSK